MLKDLKVEEYVDLVDSEQPIPGGGSVAALVGALGVSLSRMLAHLSVNKKLFLEAKEDDQRAFILASKDIEVYKQGLIDGIDSDALSYKCVIDAYKSKDEEKIQSALLASAFVALDIQRNAYETLCRLDNLIALGNKNVLSDLIAGTILLVSCVEISNLNITANAKLLKNNTEKEFYLSEGAQLAEKTEILKQDILKAINARL